jgi:hypothetical protein
VVKRRVKGPDYGLAPRVGSKRHLDRPTIGGVVAQVAADMGLDLHPWQRFRADVSGEIVRVGAHEVARLAARVALTIAGRQTGKTTAVTADVATRCLAPDLDELAVMFGHPIGPQHVAFTAQDRIGALGRWYEHVEMIMDSSLASEVVKVVRKNGEECVHWRNGSKYRVVTPSKTGARGLSLDLVVIDEALAHEPWLLPAISPTMAQRHSSTASFGAQLVIVSNAGDESAHLLNQQRELGRRAALEDEPSRVHLEWSAADDDDPLDPAVWRATIPTLGIVNGIEEEALVVEAETIGTDAFAREYLCKSVVSTARQVISPDAWNRLPRLDLTAGPGVVIAIEATDDRSSTSVVAARLMGGRVAVELVEQREGVGWVVDYVATLSMGTNARVAVDPYGPAAPLLPMLRRAGCRVAKLDTRDVPDAAGWFVDQVHASRVGHMGDDRMLNAVAVLARRKRGDRWVFDRDKAGDVTPIVAASLAVWLVDSRPSKAPAIHAGPTSDP